MSSPGAAREEVALGFRALSSHCAFPETDPLDLKYPISGGAVASTGAA
jgi:hypothetical protein